MSHSHNMYITYIAAAHQCHTDTACTQRTPSFQSCCQCFSLAINVSLHSPLFHSTHHCFTPLTTVSLHSPLFHSTHHCFTPLTTVSLHAPLFHSTHHCLTLSRVRHAVSAHRVLFPGTIVPCPHSLLSPCSDHWTHMRYGGSGVQDSDEDREPVVT